MIMKSKMFDSLKVLVIKTDEELEIARECIEVLEKR
jgi:acetate kinase